MTTTVSAGVGVSGEMARSWLLVAGSRPEEFDTAAGSTADQIILDIEDGVDPARKDEAREAVARWLASGGSGWVRINDRTSAYWSDDVQTLAGLSGLRGVVLAKAESAVHVTETFDRLGGSTAVLPLVESALGIEEAVGIAAARGTFRLAFGSGDYRRDTGASADDLAMAYPRTRLVLASRIGGLPGPIDGPTVGHNYRALRDQTATGVALGLTGKLCLEPEQLPIINEGMSPTPADLAWANDFYAEFEARGRTIRDGSDLPRLGRAEKIRTLAEAFGLTI